MKMERSASPSPACGPERGSGCSKKWPRSRRKPIAMKRVICGPPCRGESEKALLIGGHIDSVPNGGWLDGCLNTLAGVEILRRMHKRNTTASPRSRCGWSTGPMKKARVSARAFSGPRPARAISTWTKRARSRIRAASALPESRSSEHGIEFENVKDCGKELANAAAYLELHIEQGPVLLDLDLPLGSGARHVWRGTARHHFSRPGRALRQHADEPPQRRVPRRGANEPGDLSHRGTTRRRLHHRLCTTKPGHRHQRGGRLPHHARSTPSRCRGARADVAGSERSERTLREGRKRHRGVGTALAHRAHSVRSGPDRVCRRSDQRNGRKTASPALGPACTTRPKSRARACRRS